MLSWEQSNQKLEAYQKYNNSIGLHVENPIKTNVGMAVYQSLSGTVIGTYNWITNPIEIYDTLRTFAMMGSPSMTPQRIISKRLRNLPELL
ncbi:hypothetical protein EHE19_008660 [Ruminiclostridium herbifermentans]|uniref:Uncharacterized protein n=1 Tax=Ruminiclostridium herbifermentans TaxID=2488810 RepID=A0A4U7JJ96_9FIRM|nr:hypothetical protein [Ruminiclostridium herbifermentans]QNU68452.1 hypothetical protein EHE19_008660 [Ruminiclostridium herbifermentans]